MLAMVESFQRTNPMQTLPIRTLVAGLAALLVAACGASSGSDAADPDASDVEIAGVDAAPEAADAGPEAADTAPEATVDPGVRLVDLGWRRGDLHMHTTYSDGTASVALTIAYAEYLEDPTFLAFHPEYEGNGLDFIAVTDHRTLDAPSDPAWASDRLVLVPGEELGGDGHANLFGIDAFVSHDPGNDGTTLADLQAALAEVHAQGGVFSPNHPLSEGDAWAWDLRGVDALEIWNSKWGFATKPITAEFLAAWEQGHGAASPMFRKAIEQPTQQTLRLYEAMLARGEHPGLVGGSDRHQILLNGFPTTWVLPTGPGVEGVVGGLRAGHTFVSRSPVSATLEVSVTVPSAALGAGGATTAHLGDAVTLPAGGADAVVTVRVGRASGGLLRLVKGAHVASDAELPTASLGQVVAELPVVGEDATLEAGPFAVKPGDWIYAIVLEPLYAPGLTAPQQAAVDALLDQVAGSSAEGYGALAQLFVDYLDLRLLAHAEDCDPAEWDATMLQCVPARVGDEIKPTFFIPDWLDRGLNAFQESDGTVTWSLGAIGSAVRFE